MENTFSVEYTIARIPFRNEETGYTIALIKQIKFDEGHEKTLNDYIIRGVFNRIDIGDRFRSICEWVDDKKYGQQLNSKSSIIVIPSNIRGIKRFMRRSIKGIGKKTADLLVNEYGVHTLDKIREGTHNIIAIKGIGKAKAQRIYEEILKHDAIESLSVFLFSKGVTNYNDIVQIYEKLGDTALDCIKANPYVLCDLISITKLPMADTIALQSGFACDSLIRVSKIILYYLNQNCFSFGHMYMPFDVIANNIHHFLSRNHICCNGVNEQTLSDALSLLENSGSVIIDTSTGLRNIYIGWLFHVESNISKQVVSILKDKYRTINNVSLQVFLDHLEDTTGMHLDNAQQDAVRHAYEYLFSIITGGPGTGKTQTLNTIIQYLKHTDKDCRITLAAPTGRAAQRMKEATNHEAYTIHRLLGICNAEHINTLEVDTELDTDYLICDEASMIDAPLFNKLLNVVVASKVALILVGDKDQLPPVGPGMVFKELIESGVVPTTRLETLYRQAKESQIYSNAKKILNGIDYAGAGGLEFDIAKQDFFFLPGKNPEDIHRLLLKSIDSLLNLGTKPEDIMVLSSMRKSTVGVIYLNELLQQHLNPKTDEKSEMRNGTYLLREGDRVMQTKNNYDLAVFNGDIGIIENIDKDEDEVIVSFEDDSEITGKRFVIYEGTFISELELAYSITVHKSQGGEYPCVLMPFHPLLVNLSRSVLYTAVTRAKNRYVAIGDSRSFYEAINKTDNMCRYTLIQKRICQHIDNQVTFTQTEKDTAAV